MNILLEDMALALKQARERKGLSQRAASAASGVHQYQISKIENGSVDPRLSTLIHLARALDLELRLVPCKAVPTVDSLVRQLTRSDGDPALSEPESAYRLDDDG